METLNYLRGKVDNDLNVVLKYNVDDKGWLEYLFWVDGSYRLDYQCFSEVLAIDTTNKKNKYTRPLVIFYVVYHHKNIMVFGCVTMANETEETYNCVLMALLETMEGKQPLLVITGSDNAM